MILDGDTILVGIIEEPLLVVVVEILIRLKLVGYEIGGVEIVFVIEVNALEPELLGAVIVERVDSMEPELEEAIGFELEL